MFKTYENALIFWGGDLVDKSRRQLEWDPSLAGAGGLPKPMGNNSFSIGITTPPPPDLPPGGDVWRRL